jgi:hypothetical protein
LTLNFLIVIFSTTGKQSNSINEDNDKNRKMGR